MRNFVAEPKFILDSDGSAELSLEGQWSSVAIEIIGTFEGFLTVRGVITGANLPTLFLENTNGGGQASGPNQITAAGVYRCAPAAFQAIRVVPDETFESTAGVQVVFSASESLPPIAIAGFG